MDQVKLQEVESVWSFLKILAACIGTAAAVVSMAYDKFQTVDAARVNEQAVERRLERIENKLDQILINDRKGN
jgi:hypothetical protein